jgi:nitrogen fixation-related uncharacterized protein
MTPQELMIDVAFILTLVGSIAAFWWRVEGKVKNAEDKADKALTQLSDHKLHVAESYITKAGMRETTDQIMSAIGTVKSAVESLGGRIDNLYSKHQEK